MAKKMARFRQVCRQIFALGGGGGERGVWRGRCMNRLVNTRRTIV